MLAGFTRGLGTMAGELSGKSSSRNGVEVIWLAVHTAEGPTDDMPADPALDSGSARQLLRYFQRADVRASSHAIADDDELLDDLVPYGRASWTLRGGNARSDNIELCGMAGWPRSTWLKHVGMLNNCARWIASRVKARPGIPVRFIGTGGVRSYDRGVIGHVNYTEGTGDGTHWDPGPGFPWDYVIGKAAAYLTGTPIKEDTLSAEDVAAINKHTSATAAELYRWVTRAEFDGKVSPAHLPNSIAGLRAQLAGQVSALAAVQAAADAVRADQSVSGQREEKALALLAEIEADLPEPELTPEA